jgi:hypothetical protein
MAGKLGPSDLPADAGIGVSFTREDGRSVLVLTMPEMKEDDAAKIAALRRDRGAAKPDPVPEVPAEVAKMMQDMLKGMSIEIAINLEGTIVSTNAPYVEGTKVTLMKMEFAELLKDINGLQAMMEKMGDAPDLEDLMKIPGLKVVTQREVRIVFTSFRR